MSAPDVVAGRLRAQRPYGRERLLYPPLLLALIGAYYGAAQLGYALEVAGPVAAIVWLPVGVAIAFLYLGGLSLWPGVVIGDLLANDYGAAARSARRCCQTCGNLLEVVVAVLLLRRLVRDGSPLRSVRGADGHARRDRRRAPPSARRSARSRSSPAT